MLIHSQTPVSVNFGGIFMAEWIKRAASSAAPRKLDAMSIVALVLRRGRRAFVNEEDLIQNLMCKFGAKKCAHSIVTVDFDQNTFQEALDVVSGSQVLMGVHGAGLTNLIFLPAGGGVVELRLAKSRPDYVQLCHSFGKLHVEFKGTSMVTPTGSVPWAVQDDRDLLVEVLQPEELARVVANTVRIVQARVAACC